MVLYKRLKKLGIAVDGQNGISQWLGMLGFPPVGEDYSKGKWRELEAIKRDTAYK